MSESKQQKEVIDAADIIIPSIEEDEIILLDDGTEEVKFVKGI